MKSGRRLQRETEGKKRVRDLKRVREGKRQTGSCNVISL